MTFKKIFSKAKRIGFNAFTKVCSRTTDAFILSSYLPVIENIKLQISLGQIPTFWHSPVSLKVSPDINLRNRFRINTNISNSFEGFLCKIIPEQIPTIYLEGFTDLRKLIFNLPWPESPKVIFTANAHFVDDVFKGWAALKVCQGTPYVISQHGGNYGTAKYVPNSGLEQHEITTSDRYLTWGWKEAGKKYYPAVAQNLIGREFKNYNSNGDLILVQIHRDLRDTPWDETAIYKSYINNQFKFVKTLANHIQHELTVRLHSLYPMLVWEEDRTWEKKIPGIKIVKGTDSIENRIKNCRLTVYTYNSTGILENLSQNIPTIFFWNPKHWELRASALPYFEQLKQVGVFHDAPESAAKKINEVWDDVETWWDDEILQNARSIFCNRFARKTDNSTHVLKNALLTACN